MKNLRQILSVLLLLLPAVSMANAQSSPHSGEWEINMNTPGGVRTYKAIFNVEGEKLSGEIQRSTGNVKLTGTIKGSAIEFSYTISYQGNDVEITMAGKIEGETAGGTVSFNGNAAEEWSGKRIKG